MADCLQAAPLPRGQPDLRHPRREEAVNEARPHLHRAAPRSAPGLDARRRRRHGHRLRRLADRLRVVASTTRSQEYADDVVYRIKSVCDEAGVPHPMIISESGRAMVAYHSVLVIDVLGTSDFDRSPTAPDEPSRRAEAPQPVLDLLRHLPGPQQEATCSRVYHDAVPGTRRGDEPVQPRLHVARACGPLAEQLFWAIGQQDLQRIGASARRARGVREPRHRALATCTSATSPSSSRCPTRWAIDQLFPIMPIHRLNEQPTRRGILGDITCDSDGKIDHFIDLRDVKKTLELHRSTAGRAVLPGRVPAGGVPGNPGRPAQPVRRHPRRAHLARRDAGSGTSTRSSRATRSRKCSSTCSTTSRT